MSSYRFQTQSPFSFTPRNRITFAVQRLIVINIVVFAVQLMVNIPLGGSGPVLGGLPASWLAFHPNSFLHGFVWQPFTYMFLHSGLLHLFFNMMVLFFFGPDVERILSTRQFFRFYILCGGLGVLAGLVPLFVSGASSLTVGASGATLGVLVAFAVAYPDREIFLFPIPFPINVRAIVFVIIIMTLIQSMGDSSISVSTHVGGMVVGYAYMKLTPLLRNWLEARRQSQARRKGHADPLGEAVDNIFKFEDEKRRRK